MSQEALTKRITSNQESMLLAKLRNYFRRSVLKYLLASGLLAIGIPSIFGGFLMTFIVVFLCLCILSMIVMFTSSKVQARNSKFDANVTFEEGGITIQHLNKDLHEEKQWSWIVNAQENQVGFFLLIQKHPRLELNLLKDKLSDNETITFRSLLRNKSLIS